MRITDSRGRTISLASAIEGSLDDSSHGSGQMEDMAGAQRLTGIMLGQLVSMLYDKGVISDVDVNGLLGWGFSVSRESGE